MTNNVNTTKPKKSEYDFITPIVALIVLGAIAYGVNYWFTEVRKPSSYSVCFEGANYTDRGISDFYVNSLYGGKIEAREGDYPYGEGGGGCTGSVSGKTATVRWVYSHKTIADRDNNVPQETHEVTVPMPVAESNHSRYFKVRIFPDNHVELQLTDLPASDRNAEEGALVSKLINAEIKAVDDKERAQKDAELAQAKKFEDDNEAAYKRYAEEYKKKQGGQ